MPAYCVAVGCKNKRNSKTKEKNITFHRFPRDPKRQKQWSDAIQRQSKDGKDYKPNHYSFICSEHFTDKDFNRFGNTIRLWERAVPSVFNTLHYHSLGCSGKDGKPVERKLLERQCTDTNQTSKLPNRTCCDEQTTSFQENSATDEQEIHIENVPSTYIEVNLDPEQLYAIIETASTTMQTNTPSNLPITLNMVTREHNQCMQPKPPETYMKRLTMNSDIQTAANEDHCYQLPEAQALRIRLERLANERDRLQRELRNSKDREQRSRKNCEALLFSLNMRQESQNEIEIMEI